ncbi:MAG: peptidoglycan bridge formation glycyltransferase FemA/FemB family protein [Bacilli bacterium]|nr:peptidoglycan bridge formation glycyltransferase FemA/FemB family protein [Bacilli bacterium]MBR1936110.1 peptidoglycan bridge formation glycyltransferase FemA/FemB family protein [Bacilli bacterium]
MRIVKLSSSQFDRFTTTHRYRNFYQTSMYANVMRKFGYDSQYLGITDDNNVLIGASLIIYKEVFMKNKIAYAPRGILYNYENPEDVKLLANTLKKSFGNEGFMLLRMDPYIPITIRDFEGNIINFNNKTDQLIENLEKSGFKYKGRNLFFETEKPRWESIVVLKRDLREISSKIDKRVRNKINKAMNSGITIVKDNNNNVNKLYTFIQKKEKKPLSYYKEICNQFSSDVEIYYALLNTEEFLINTRRNLEKEEEYNDTLKQRLQDVSITEKDKTPYLNKKMESDRLLTVYKENLEKSTELLKSNPEGIVIAGAMVIKYDNSAYIFVEGLDDKYGYLNANYLLKWQLIKDFNERGFKYINLNAIVGEFEEKNKYSGLNEAKLGFNSTVTEYIGEFDIILNSFSYNLYKKFNRK